MLGARSNTVTFLYYNAIIFFIVVANSDILTIINQFGNFQTLKGSHTHTEKEKKSFDVILVNFILLAEF